VIVLKARSGRPEEDRSLNLIPKRWLNRKVLSVLVIVTGSGALLTHTMAARLYYAANSASMRLVAETAVRAGAQYLPAEPAAAMRAAQDSAELCGIAPSEIVETQVAADNQGITLSLSRKVPRYVAFLAVGLPSHEIHVTASARRVHAHAPANPNRILA
jgi:hypothetical protein